jgi:hypothetical protein
LATSTEEHEQLTPQIGERERQLGNFLPLLGKTQIALDEGPNEERVKIDGGERFAAALRP